MICANEFVWWDLDTNNNEQYMLINIHKNIIIH